MKNVRMSVQILISYSIVARTSALIADRLYSPIKYNPFSDVTLLKAT